MALFTKADADDGKKTDEIHKKVDFDRPIHRIGLRTPAGSPLRRPPSFRPDLTGPQIDGKGFDRQTDQGFQTCRRPADLKATARNQRKVLAEIVAELARIVPAWVLVPSSGVAPPQFQEPNAAFQEVEGTLIRSFQTWTDVPVAQYHQWYDWNFHVEPADGYRHLPGPANAAEIPAGKTAVVKGARPTIECEWDTGAFGKVPGSMFRADWCWPMAGDFAWVAGRWIYDCGHANTPAQGEQVRTELHPCAAVATARWEGVQFTSNQTEIIWPPQPGSPNAVFRPAKDTPGVPGIRFMFFASRNGGYHNFPSLANPNILSDKISDKNYRFIVDVPRILGDNRVVVAGATPDFPASTITALNPRLLASFSFDAFANNSNGKFQKVDPIITVIDPGNGQLPEQVIVEIPIDKLDSDTQAYGVIIALGWHDEGNVLAKRVMKCDVNVVLVDIPDSRARPSSLSDPAFLVKNWTFKIGVNGRWHRHETGPLGIGPAVNNIRHRFPTFFLPLDHPTAAGTRAAEVKVNAHGKILFPVGEFLKKPAADRTLKIGNRVPTYDPDIVRARDTQALEMVEALAVMQAQTFKQQNEAIGIIDVRETVANVVAAGGTKRIFPAGLTVEELGDLAELVFVNDKPGQEKIDYRISVSIKISPQ